MNQPGFDKRLSECDKKKQKLLEMARRPPQKKTLGKALSRYTDKGGNSYDAKFDKQIRELAPHWFVNTADEKKKKLLKMTHKEQPRPEQKTPLGQALSSYTHKSQTNYDPEFHNEIKRLAPHWFTS